MKTQKTLMLLSLISTIVSIVFNLILYFVIDCESSAVDFYKNFSWSVFGSSLLTFLTATINYVNEKRALEKEIFYDVTLIYQHFQRYKFIENKDTVTILKDWNILIQTREITWGSLRSKTNQYRPIFMKGKRYKSVTSIYEGMSKFFSGTYSLIEELEKLVSYIDSMTYAGINGINEKFKEIEKQMGTKSYKSTKEGPVPVYSLVEGLSKYWVGYVDTILNKSKKDYVLFEY